LYAATDNGVYAFGQGSFSLATHGTWKDAGLDNIDVNTLLVMKGVLYAGTTGDLENGGVYELRGGAWSQVGPSINLNSAYDASGEVHALAGLNGVLYAGTAWGVYAYH
jgi:hypothetical protein